MGQRQKSFAQDDRQYSRSEHENGSWRVYGLQTTVPQTPVPLTLSGLTNANAFPPECMRLILCTLFQDFFTICIDYLIFESYTSYQLPFSAVIQRGLQLHVAVGNPFPKILQRKVSV